MKRRGSLQLYLDVVLAALFIAALFCLGIGTLISEGDGLRGALASRQRLRTFLDDPDDAGVWDRFAARIHSLDDYLAKHLFLDDELGHLNARFQYALGKRMLQSGGELMLTLEGGQLYDLQDKRIPMKSAAREVLRLRASLPADTPFLFAYAHPGVYERAQFPPGYETLDYSNEMADELLDLLSAAGVPLLDSRAVLRASGLSSEQYLLRTDSHWATRAALEMARAAAQSAARLTGAELRSDLLDVRNFDSYTYPALFLGAYGQRVGAALAMPDDITIYWPRYRTNIRRRTEYLGEYTDVEGEFRDSVIRWRYLRALDVQSWNTVAYFDYGLTEDCDLYENHSAADCTILLLKDSFSAAMGGFLSLAADRVCAVDLRRSDRSLREWIDAVRPDIVIAAFSLPYLLNEAYDFP